MINSELIIEETIRLLNQEDMLMKGGVGESISTLQNTRFQHFETPDFNTSKHQISTLRDTRFQHFETPDFNTSRHQISHWLRLVLKIEIKDCV